MVRIKISYTNTKLRDFVRGGLMIASIAAMLAASVSITSAATPAVVVKMSDKPPQFEPAKVTIKVGQTVQWLNNAQTLHSVDADPSMVQNGKDVALPPGAQPFDSGFMQPGATFEHKFTAPGVYKYTCVPHEKDNMMGEVDVEK